MTLATGVLLAGCMVMSPPAPTPRADPTDPAVPTPPPEPVRYVALGDSYTIGTGLPRRIDRWPNQLQRALRPIVELELVANLAVNGRTTLGVIEEQLPDLEQADPDLVTLLVGVNDVILGTPPDEYRANLQLILDGGVAVEGERPLPGLLDLVGADRVVLITTPDYTLTPKGDQFTRTPEEKAAHAATIDEFNRILREEADARGIAVVDITPISDLVPSDPTLTAADDLHPSGKQYAGWVELIAPVVAALLDEAAG
jgi:lysophospholipase L1-like esterase